MTYDKRGYTFLTEKKIIQLHIFFKCVWFKRCNLQRIDNFYSYSKVCVVTVSHNQHKSIKYKDWDCYTKKPYHLSNLSICSVDNVLIRWNQRSWIQAPAEDEVEFQYGELQKTLYINPSLWADIFQFESFAMLHYKKQWQTLDFYNLKKHKTVGFFFALVFQKIILCGFFF